jgi:hypothetical protein
LIESSYFSKKIWKSNIFCKIRYREWKREIEKWKEQIKNRICICSSRCALIYRPHRTSGIWVSLFWPMTQWFAHWGTKNFKGSSIYGVTVLGGRGSKFLWQQYYVLSNKMCDEGGWGSKNVQYCVTSLMNGPLFQGKIPFFKVKNIAWSFLWSLKNILSSQVKQFKFFQCPVLVLYIYKIVIIPESPHLSKQSISVPINQCIDFITFLVSKILRFWRYKYYLNGVLPTKLFTTVGIFNRVTTTTTATTTTTTHNNRSIAYWH